MSKASRGPQRDTSPSQRKSRRLNRYQSDERLATPFLALPDVVRFEICRALDVRSVLRLSMTSKEVARRLPWKMLADTFWRALRLKVDGLAHEDRTDFRKRLSANTGNWELPSEDIDRKIHAEHLWLRDLAKKEELPATDDYQALFRRLAGVTCIICSAVCGRSQFWYGHRLCQRCHAEVRYDMLLSPTPHDSVPVVRTSSSSRAEMPR